MFPKEFIKQVLIGEIEDVVERHPYLAFSLIGINKVINKPGAFSSSIV